jgi:hypothetical protein
MRLDGQPVTQIRSEVNSSSTINFVNFVSSVDLHANDREHCEHSELIG